MHSALTRLGKKFSKNADQFKQKIKDLGLAEKTNKSLPSQTQKYSAIFSENDSKNILTQREIIDLLQHPKRGVSYEITMNVFMDSLSPKEDDSERPQPITQKRHKKKHLAHGYGTIIS